MANKHAIVGESYLFFQNKFPVKLNYFFLKVGSCCILAFYAGSYWQAFLPKMNRNYPTDILLSIWDGGGGLYFTEMLKFFSSLLMFTFQANHHCLYALKFSSKQPDRSTQKDMLN